MGYIKQEEIDTPFGDRLKYGAESYELRMKQEEDQVPVPLLQPQSSYTTPAEHLFRKHLTSTPLMTPPAFGMVNDLLVPYREHSVLETPDSSLSQVISLGREIEFDSMAMYKPDLTENPSNWTSLFESEKSCDGPNEPKILQQEENLFSQRYANMPYIMPGLSVFPPSPKQQHVSPSGNALTPNSEEIHKYLQSQAIAAVSTNFDMLPSLTPGSSAGSSKSHSVAPSDSSSCKRSHSDIRGPGVLVKSEEEKAVIKRVRNTEAARRSRARKVERMQELEEKVDQLVKRNNELEQEVWRLRILMCRDQDLMLAANCRQVFESKF